MAGDRMTEPVFFESASAWRAWLEKNHATANAIMLGLVKVGSGLRGLDYRQALDEALCYGWIDGVRKTVDDRRWTIRFSPRKRRSVWSAVNLKRAEELKREGRMTAAGLKVLQDRDRSKERSYSFENRNAALAGDEEQRFRANDAAWQYFAAMPKSYRHPAIWWVVSAKREETRARRLATLIDDSAAGRKIKPLRHPGDKGTNSGEVR
jgi:uncharacterized protein YdeI (YjbR/CyaY-like superfamily)